MEFKDSLKKFRQERKLSQQALAKEIYVSRSAVAKWENGLGLPNRASYEALLAYFEITEDAFPLNEEEEAPAITRNKKIHLIKELVFWLSLALITALPLWLIHALSNGFGFTPEGAAGELWADEAYIETPEYRFYYDTYVDEQGEPLPMIWGFCAVKRLPIGYQRLDISDYQHTAYAADRKDEKWYAFPGDSSYYNFFVQTMVATQEEGLRLELISEILIDGKTYPVLYNCYLETDFAIREFSLKDVLYRIEP